MKRDGRGPGKRFRDGPKKRVGVRKKDGVLKKDGVRKKDAEARQKDGVRKKDGGDKEGGPLGPEKVMGAPDKPTSGQYGAQAVHRTPDDIDELMENLEREKQEGGDEYSDEYMDADYYYDEDGEYANEDQDESGEELSSEKQEIMTAEELTGAGPPQQNEAGADTSPSMAGPNLMSAGSSPQVAASAKGPKYKCSPLTRWVTIDDNFCRSSPSCEPASDLPRGGCASDETCDEYPECEGISDDEDFDGGKDLDAMRCTPKHTALTGWEICFQLGKCNTNEKDPCEPGLDCIYHNRCKVAMKGPQMTGGNRGVIRPGGGAVGTPPGPMGTGGGRPGMPGYMDGPGISGGSIGYFPNTRMNGNYFCLDPDEDYDLVGEDKCKQMPCTGRNDLRCQSLGSHLKCITAEECIIGP